MLINFAADVLHFLVSNTHTEVTVSHDRSTHAWVWLVWNQLLRVGVEA